ncbi:MAG: glycosyltransferase [Candidatus Thermoplasmatota archaeon]|nr:glycosyltransferase [Candidatus Thermoplasmatota archaeon]MBS3790898.1 glycosyltransferase [Candidatus Thermoplasmatota archaeon]
MDDLRILVIPTTDWTGHPVPNRLNFIFDRLSKRHNVDICHFKMFDEEKRETKCNLIDMGCKPNSEVGTYYLTNFRNYSEKLRDISEDYDVLISSNIIPGFMANLQDTVVIMDYLDHFPQSASSYYEKPLDRFVEKIADWLTSFNLKKADGIITPTSRFKDHLGEKIDSDIIKVVPNGLDLDKINAVDPSKIYDKYDLSKPVLGYVGSLEGWIDLESVIELMPSIKKRYPKAKLLVVGPDLHTDYSDFLEELSEKIGVEDDVIFVGRVDYDDLSPYISAMDVGLNPRKPMKMNSLTMGAKVLTYLACGVPVLSKNMPEAEERFFGEGVHSYKDPSEFLGKLAGCLAENVYPDVVRKYDWDILSREYEKAILEFMNREETVDQS